MIAVPSTPDSEPPATLLTHGSHLQPYTTTTILSLPGYNLGSLISSEEFAYGLLSKYLPADVQ